MRIGDTEMNSGELERSLRMRVDTKLDLNENLDDKWYMIYFKWYTLLRVMPYMSLSTEKVLVNSIFNSECSYCSLITCIRGISVCSLGTGRHHLSKINLFRYTLEIRKCKSRKYLKHIGIYLLPSSVRVFINGIWL